MTNQLFPELHTPVISVRPISFTASSINKIQKQRKTQTRRTLYPQPETSLVQDAGNPLKWIGEGEHIWRSTFGIPGDELWVKEIWARVEPYPTDVHEDYELPVAWKVEKNPVALEYWRKRILFYADFRGRMPEECNKGATDNQWRSSSTMPRWAARLWLKIISNRPERLQEISEEDALAEGIQQQALPGLDGNWYYWNNPAKRYKTAVAAYAALWDSINGKKNPWALNPWVWRIAFEKIAG